MPIKLIKAFNQLRVARLELWVCAIVEMINGNKQIIIVGVAMRVVRQMQMQIADFVKY